MAMEAIDAAARDAGLPVEELDGLVSHSSDPITEFEVLNSFGLKNLTYFVKVPGSNAAGAVALAAMGAAAGRAKHVAVFRSMKAFQGHSFRYDGPMDRLPRTVSAGSGFRAPFGLLTDAHLAAIRAQDYVATYNADPLAFGWIAVACRRHGSVNPHSVFAGQAVTIGEYEDAPFVAAPLRAPDCAVGADGASAVIVVAAERAKGLARRPVYIAAAAQATGSNAGPASVCPWADISPAEEHGALSRRLFAGSGFGVRDLDFAEIEDRTSPDVLTALEGLGLCPIGEGWEFVRGASRISWGGEIPVNTHGGTLGEGNIESMNHVVEAARQLRGEASLQVAGAELGLVVSGAGIPSSGLLLRK